MSRREFNSPPGRVARQTALSPCATQGVVWRHTRAGVVFSDRPIAEVDTMEAGRFPPLLQPVRA